jgi:hypothetical protein
MPGERIQPPEWAIGDISELVGYVQSHSATPAGTDQVIGQMAAAVDVWRTDMARYAEHCGCFCDVVYMRNETVHDGAGLDRAVMLWQEATAAPGISGLVRNRLRLLGLQLDMAVAGRDGGPAARAERLSAHSAALGNELELLVAPTLLGDLVRNSVRWAETAITDEQWAAAARAYELAARAADQLFRTVQLRDRLAVLATFRTVPAEAASVLLRTGRTRDAVAHLEAARQRYTRFQRGMTDLERLLKTHDPELYERFSAEMARWAAAADQSLHETGPAEIQAAQTRVRELAARVNATLTEVQQLPGLERYMMSPGFGDIRQAAADFPVLYVWASRRDTCVALVLSDGTAHGSYLDGLTTEYLSRILADWTAGLQLTVPTTGRQRKLALTLVGKILEPSVGVLLKQVLTSRFTEAPDGDGWRWGPVVVVVSGLLSFAPVHVWSPYIADDVTGEPRYHMPLMYAPSARQALTARRSPRPLGASRRLLSLADPEPRPEGLKPLPCARLESALISRTAREPLLLAGQDATQQAFLELAPKYEVVHLACHGSAGTGMPGSAWLELGGRKLSADDILGRLVLDDTALVVLSACRSGQPDSVIPEESLDLASMFLAAGARAVVANMWPVDELAATLFVWRMFTLWDWGARLPLPAAVHAARLWLKDLTLMDLEAIARDEPLLEPAIRRSVRLLSPPTMKRFGEPYYWAAFAYTGA